MKKVLFVLSAVILVAMAGAAQAAFVNAPVPSNAYITYNGYDWAWASPCSDDSCGMGFGLDLSYQSTYGWRVPTAAELNAAPLATDFVFPGANVPRGGTDPVSGATVHFGDPGGDLAVAVPYFNIYYTHADWGNAPGSGGGLVFPWNTTTYSEFLVVRNVVPLPASLLLFGPGLVSIAAIRRRSRK